MHRSGPASSAPPRSPIDGATRTSGASPAAEATASAIATGGDVLHRNRFVGFHGRFANAAPRTPAPPGAPIPFCPFKAAPGFERHAVPIKPFPWFAEPAGASSAARLANRFAPWAWLAPAQPPSLPGRSPAPCSHAWWQARFGWPAEPSTLQHTRCSRAELTELRRCPRAARSS